MAIRSQGQQLLTRRLDYHSRLPQVARPSSIAELSRQAKAEEARTSRTEKIGILFGERVGSHASPQPAQPVPEEPDHPCLEEGVVRVDVA
eukprot:7582766-Pyramimonas_sp.AAC.1